LGSRFCLPPFGFDRLNYQGKTILPCGRSAPEIFANAVIGIATSGFAGIFRLETKVFVKEKRPRWTFRERTRPTIGLYD
jgi:hypothetical protein